MARLLRQHGLSSEPFHEIDLTDVWQLVDLYPADERLVARTSRKGTSDRNLPRLVDATAQSIIAWSNNLQPGTVLLVSPYGHLIASAEVALTTSWVIVEAVYGVWELDNRQRPVSATGRRADGGIEWTRWALPTTGAERRFSFDAGVATEGPVPSWLLHAFCGWASFQAPNLDALATTIGRPQIVKVLLYAEWGMQAMNARTIGDGFEPAYDDPPSPPTGTPLVSSTDQSISPAPAVVLTVAAAREDAASLDRLIGRMVGAGVEVAYLESGLLSHTAIALREAGISVRRA